MRYKAYLINDTNQILSSGPPLIRQGNNFVDAQFPGVSDHPSYQTAVIGLTRLNDCKEVKDGIWTWTASKMGDTFIVPESNEFFNIYIFLDSNTTLGFSGNIIREIARRWVKKLAIDHFKS